MLNTLILGKDDCTGDSGGPLVSREYSGEPWYQVGVRSEPQGKSCQESNKPGVYTYIVPYLDWIISNLEG